MDRTNIQEFTYHLETVKVNIENWLDGISDFEETFKPRFNKAVQAKKDGGFITNHEFECTLKLYRCIQRELSINFRVLLESAKHEKTQTRLLEVQLQELKEQNAVLELSLDIIVNKQLQEEILERIKTNKAA